MIFCVLYLKRNVCPQLAETTLLRWRAEKSLKHYSRSLLAYQLGAVNGPTAIRLDKYSHKPDPSSTEDDGLQELPDRQSVTQTARETRRQVDRLTNRHCPTIAMMSAEISRGWSEGGQGAGATVQGRHHLSQLLSGTWKIIFICRTLILNGRPFSSLFSLARKNRKTRQAKYKDIKMTLVKYSIVCMWL